MANAGKHKLWVNSVPYVLKEEPTFELGGTEREDIEIPGGEVNAFSETEKKSYVSGNLLYTEGMDIAELKATKNATVMLETPTGDTYVFKDAYFSGPCEVSAGAVPFKFVGLPNADRL